MSHHFCGFFVWGNKTIRPPCRRGDEPLKTRQPDFVRGNATHPPDIFINCTSSAQLQIKDKLRTFPRREGFTRNKEKISNLICFEPFVILSKPSLPGQGQRPSAPSTGRALTPLNLASLEGKEKTVQPASHSPPILTHVFIQWTYSKVFHENIWFESWVFCSAHLGLTIK